MALKAHLRIGPVLDVPRLPTAGMRPGFASGVALNADVPLGVAGLAGLQVPACFDGVLSDAEGIRLVIGPQHRVRLDAQGALGESFVAGIAKGNRVVAAIAVLRIVLRLDRVDADPVAAMGLRFIVAAELALRQITTRAPTIVAVKAPLLIVALGAVVAGLAGQHPVAAEAEILIVVGGDPLGLVAFVAVAQRRVLVFRVRDLLILGVRLLLEAEKSKAKCCQNKNEFLHACLLF